MYHRIGSKKYEWAQPALDISAFDRHLVYLRKNFTVIPLQELAERARKKELPTAAVAAITFDDGYKDFYQYAYPLLRKYNLPATIFLTAGHIDSDKLFWWDKIRYYITHCQTSTIELSGEGMIRIEGDLQRQLACEYLISRITVIDSQNQQSLLQQLREETRVEDPHGIARELILDWKEVRTMADDGIEIGAHTMTHPVLTQSTLNEADQEIVLSKKVIENKIQKPVLSFAYPSGFYNNEIRSIVCKSGFNCAVIVGERVVDYEDNTFELPRCSGYEDYDYLTLNLMGLITDLKRIGLLARLLDLNSL
jgi:peptidoglycan/xylan/chitin deacetylase (PgdA/CDA1 family)